MTMVVRSGGLDLDLVDGQIDLSSTGYTYCGIGIINRNLALGLKRDLIPSVFDLEISGFLYNGPYFDIGSPEGYLDCIKHTGGYISPDADLEGTEIESGCYVGSGVRLRNGRVRDAVILPGTILPDEDNIEHAIIAQRTFINC